MDPQILTQLRRCPLFRGLEPPALSGLLLRASHRLLEAPRGRLVLCRGEPYEALHVLLQGSVSAEMEDQNGRVLKVETIAAPSLLASGILFAPEARLPVSLRALSRVRLLVLPRAALLACCRQYPGVLEALLGDMGSRTAFLAEKLRMNQFTSIRQKLASYLLERAGPDGRVTLSLGRQTLAEVFGVARPSLSRVFGELARRGWVRRLERGVYQLDRGALEGVLRGAD